MNIVFGVAVGLCTFAGLVASHCFVRWLGILDTDRGKMIRLALFTLVILGFVNFASLFRSHPAMRAGDYKQNIICFILAWAISGQGLFLIYLFKTRNT